MAAEEVSKQAPPMTSSLLIPAHPLLGREENMKLLFDEVKADAMNGVRNATDWSNARARIDIRSERNAASLDKVLDSVISVAFLNSMVAAQTGETENQVEQGPEDTAAGSEDTANSSVATANAQVAANIANLASALVPIIAGTSGVVTIQTLASVLPLVISAIGQGTGTTSAKS